MARHLAHAALGAVPRDRVAHLFTDDKRDARVGQPIGPRPQNKERVRPRAALLPYPLYIRLRFEPPRAFNAHERVALVRKFLGALDADGQPMAPLGPARL